MKKIFYALLIALFLIPFAVKADMGGPTFTYKARVSNKNGAVIYESKFEDDSDKVTYEKTNDVLDFDTIGQVMTEQKSDGKTYVEILVGDNKNSENYIVLATDLEPYGKINLADYENSVEEYVVFKEGAYLYNGPSFAFGKVDDGYMVPVGTTIKTKYYDELFAYVEVNGHKGWVYVYQYDEYFSPYDITGFVAYKFDKEEDPTIMYSIGELDLYEDLDGKKASVKYPANTRLYPQLVYYAEPHQSAYQITYEGKKYWFYGEPGRVKYVNEGNEKVYLFTDAKIYKDVQAPNYDKNIDLGAYNYTGVSIPKYSVIKFDASTQTEYGETVLYEVTYKGTKGWIVGSFWNDSETKTENKIASYLEFPEELPYTLKEKVAVVSNPLSNNKESFIIDKNQKFDLIDYCVSDSKTGENVSCEKYCYVLTKNKGGWAECDKIVYDKDTDIPVNPVKPLDPQEQKQKELEEKRLKRSKKLKETSDEDNDLILYCIIGGTVVVLTAVCTIVFVNKKKREKRICDTVVEEEISKEVQKENLEEVTVDEVTTDKPINKARKTNKKK